MNRKDLNQAIIDEIENEIAVEIEDFEALKETIKADKAVGDDINAAYHEGMKVDCSLNIDCLRDMLTVIRCYMDDKPVPDLLQRYPTGEKKKDPPKTSKGTIENIVHPVNAPKF